MVTVSAGMSGRPDVLSALGGVPAQPLPMVNPVRDYDWGSRTELARIQGREPSGGPEAELWMGAHPAAPSLVPGPDGTGRGLDQAIAAAPEAMLGAGCVQRFGPRLPFLLKVLAVQRALSIQVHPSPEQAAAGFAREQAAGIEPRLRSYVDPYAKPEMVVALTEFVALAGLRDTAEVAGLLGLLGLLDLPALDLPVRGPMLAALGQDARGAGRAGTARAVAALATWPAPERAELASQVRRRAEALLHAPTSACEPELGVDRDTRRALEWVLALTEQHPGDPMVLAPLVLRLHRLAPGQAMFLPAGVPHAYLSGLGMEVMSASDNVVRAGLTGKRVDADALISLLDPDAVPLLDVPSRPVPDGAVSGRGWYPPVPEFALAQLHVDGPGTLARTGGPEVVFCLEGQVEVSLGGQGLTLRAGSSAFLPALPGTDPDVVLLPAPAVLALDGRGELFRATLGAGD